MFKVGLYGTVITALCCFTPLLIGIMVGIGLAHWVAHLDTVLFPLLGFFLIVTAIGYFRRKHNKEPIE